MSGKFEASIPFDTYNSLKHDSVIGLLSGYVNNLNKKHNSNRNTDSVTRNPPNKQFTQITIIAADDDEDNFENFDLDFANQHGDTGFPGANSKLTELKLFDSNLKNESTMRIDVVDDPRKMSFG